MQKTNKKKAWESALDLILNEPNLQAQSFKVKAQAFEAFEWSEELPQNS